MDKVKKLMAEAQAFFGKAMKSAQKGAPSKPKELQIPRPMKFPYTFTAKIVQMPWVYYMKNNWLFKYYFVAIFCSLPAIKKCHDLANSEGSKAKWAEVLRKEAEEEHGHH